MPSSSTVLRMTVVALVYLGTASAFAQPPAPAEPIHSRDRSFRIPYKVDENQQPRLKEVQLHVSNDRGGSWRHYASGPPSSEFFTFTSSADGEHWFAVRTLDFEGRFDPPTLVGTRPGLIVVVDTTPPNVELRGLSPDADEAGIEWNIHDENIDLSTLRIEFRVGPSDWFPIQIESAVNGRSKFRPGVRGNIEIRLRVLDKAGNEAVQQILLTPAGGPTGPQPTFDAGAAPAFQASTNGPTTPQGAMSDFGVPPPPNATPTFRPFPPTSENSGGSANHATQPGRLVPPGAPRSSSPAPVSNQAAPPRADLKYVNSMRFGINYEVTEVGKSGIGSVALFWTYDTATWNYHGDDEDRQTPFFVEVDGEGVFGFKMIARSGAGLGDDPPNPGDPADVWVEVDITQPRIDLKPPQPGRGPSQGLLDIEWQMVEKNPAAKPITLLYSQTASGPWTPIAEDIANTGRYQWRMPTSEEFPYKFFVRIEGRDRAGNVGRAETPSPVVVDLTKPRLKIVRVEPNTRVDAGLEPAAAPEEPTVPEQESELEPVLAPPSLELGDDPQ